MCFYVMKCYVCDVCVYVESDVCASHTHSSLFIIFNDS